MELLKRIDDTDYFISNKGNVYRDNKKLKPIVNSRGYYVVTLYSNNQKKTKYIHRLVSENFIKNPNKYNVVNHIDENKLNNSKENLEWCTQAHNNIHGTRLQRCSESMINNKNLSKELLGINITNGYIKIFESIREAQRFGFNVGNIHRVSLGINKQHKGYRFVK